MKVVNKNTPLVLLILIGLMSCDRLFISPDAASSNLVNFDLLWSTVDKKYSYFTYKKIDWNAARVTYRPQAEKAKNDEELFQVMASMLNDLKDGHVNLKSDFDRSRNWNWFLDYPSNFNFDVVQRNYLGKDYQIAGPFVIDTLQKTGYIYLSGFLNPITDEVADKLFAKLKALPLKGLIIDIRDNGGGALIYADLFIQHLLKNKTLIGYTKYKSGPGHDEFTNYFKNELDPKGVTYTDRKIVLLTNRQVYSAANYFASALSQLADVTIIGDQTGGGGGAPISAELQAGWSVRFSATQMFDANYQHLEAGVKPDVKVDILKSDEAIGKDTILEEAIKFLNK